MTEELEIVPRTAIAVEPSRRSEGISSALVRRWPMRA